MRTIALCLFAALLAGTSRLAAQCVFDPTVTGDLLVCPESMASLGTQPYDAYQWYRRDFPNGTAQPIAGATGPTLDVAYNETPVYVFVAATRNACTENSPEVLVDGLAFLPVAVASEGKFTTGPNGEQVICTGDTIFQILLQPYTTNIQWFNGQSPIPGATDDTLVVTQPGLYWVSGSPTDCPNYTASLGVQISVVWGSTPGCATGTATPEAPPFELHLLPNPAQASVFIGVDAPGSVRLTLFDAMGRALRKLEFVVATELVTADLPAGMYSLLLETEKGSLSRQLAVQ